MSDTTGRLAAIPASISTSAPAAGPALRVYRDDSLPTDGSPTTLPVYLVSADELIVVGDQGNVPVPIAIVSDGRPAAGLAAPIAVYVVSDAPPIVVVGVRVTEAGTVRMTEAGDRRITEE